MIHTRYTVSYKDNEKNDFAIHFSFQLSDTRKYVVVFLINSLVTFRRINLISVVFFEQKCLLELIPFHVSSGKC